mmetsp:Transcript_21374/g.48235  ORF Transcript_21374/g.48235 Transcript_21374/m.48235 type:complete len:238 (+) Transcript_21374:924-1637(+)
MLDREQCLARSRIIHFVTDSTGALVVDVSLRDDRLAGINHSLLEHDLFRPQGIRQQAVVDDDRARKWVKEDELGPNGWRSEGERVTAELARRGIIPAIVELIALGRAVKPIAQLFVLLNFRIFLEEGESKLRDFVRCWRVLQHVRGQDRREVEMPVRQGSHALPHGAFPPPPGKPAPQPRPLAEETEVVAPPFPAGAIRTAVDRMVAREERLLPHVGRSRLLEAIPQPFRSAACDVN